MWTPLLTIFLEPITHRGLPRNRCPESHEQDSSARLLPKSCLPSAYEPPAEEAHKASHDNHHSDGDTCYGACAEAASAAPAGLGGHARLTLQPVVVPALAALVLLAAPDTPVDTAGDALGAVCVRPLAPLCAGGALVVHITV
eukprot:XP_001705252.1 Hypothetical protein GL50803_19007 [Giardia lamblia ATCC 50803]